MSKVISPGLRIGWIVEPEPVIQRLSDIKCKQIMVQALYLRKLQREWFTNGLYDEHLRFVRSELKNEEILCY